MHGTIKSTLSQTFGHKLGRKIGLHFSLSLDSQMFLDQLSESRSFFTALRLSHSTLVYIYPSGCSQLIWKWQLLKWMLNNRQRFTATQLVEQAKKLIICLESHHFVVLLQRSVLRDALLLWRLGIPGDIQEILLHGQKWDHMQWGSHEPGG